MFTTYTRRHLATLAATILALGALAACATWPRIIMPQADAQGPAASPTPGQAPTPGPGPAASPAPTMSVPDAAAWALKTAQEAQAKAKALEADALARGDAQAARQAQDAAKTAQDAQDVARVVVDVLRPDPSNPNAGPDLAHAGQVIGGLFGPWGVIGGGILGSILGVVLRGGVWTAGDLRAYRREIEPSKPSAQPSAQDGAQASAGAGGAVA